MKRCLRETKLVIRPFWPPLARARAMSAFDADDDDARVADTEAATEVAIGDATERPKVHREKYG